MSSEHVALQIENLQRHLADATAALKGFEKLAEGSQELKDWATNEITRFALSVRASKLDKDELENFFNYPYVIIPGKNDNERYLAIPKFIDAQFGWLHKVTPSFNIFLVNPYVDWLGELPEAIKKEMNFPSPLDIYLDGEQLVGSDLKKAEAKYGDFVRRKGDKLMIDQNRHFEFLARLIKDGIRPFSYKPIDPEDKIERKCDFELRDYQQEAYAVFLKYSNIGAFFPPSTGKTYLGIYAITHIKGPWLIAVPSRLLVEQWIERIELYTDLVVGQDVDIMTYQGAINNGHKKQYKGLIIDEVHHLPADYFSKLATVQRQYSIGLSATPQREDERENYIFALTGQPTGMSWEHFKKLGIIQNPDLHVWIVKNENERWKTLGDLLELKKKSIIFCDSLEMGKLASKRFDLPFVSGDSKQRLDKIQDNLQTIVSRVGDEGVSLPDIEQVIEISWLHGSRRQELQRFTRLLHGKNTKGIGHIIMTIQEYQTDHKRLFGIMDKGFKIILHREGVPEKAIQKPLQTNRTVIRPAQTKTRVLTVEKVEPNDFEKNHPLLGLPGIQKKLTELTKAERLSVRVLYEKPAQAMTKEEVWNFVGMGRVRDFANFTKLINMKLIKKVQAPKQADKYQAI